MIHHALAFGVLSAKICDFLAKVFKKANVVPMVTLGGIARLTTLFHAREAIFAFISAY